MYHLLCLAAVVLFSLHSVSASSYHNYQYAKRFIIIASEELNIGAELEERANRRRAGSLQVLTPSELRAVYNITYSTTAGSGKTVGIVDAYGASTAESDLATFNSQWGLPACTTANGCFKKVNQTGGTTYPVNDAGWSQETNLDVQTVHAIAPGAKILLVVAKTNGQTDMFAAINYAKAHSDYVSMSFGFSEVSSVTSLDSTFSTTPSVAFFASTGDNGAGVSYPSTSPHVVAVGGTGVYTNTDYSFADERGWSGSGGGCSSYFTAPSMQSSFAGYSSLGCSGKRAVPDVAMDADPNSGVYMYDSYGCSSPPNCWYASGGTSLAAPIFAARAAIRGAVVNLTYVYGSHIGYRDITVGSNGAYSCQVGLDLVTGRGAWIKDL